MKRTPLKRKSRTEVAKLKDKLWELCKQIIRKTYARPDGTWTCYTCKKHLIYPKDAHTAHFIPDAVCGAYLRYDLRNLRVCCYNCNINLGGNGSAYYAELVKDKGQVYVDKLFQDKHITIKADAWWYKQKISEYEVLLRTM